MHESGRRQLVLGLLLASSALLLAKAEQARAGLLPSAALSATANFSELDSSVDTQDKNFNNQTLQLSASQPLYRPANRLAYQQARQSLEAAEAQLEAAS